MTVFVALVAGGLFLPLSNQTAKRGATNRNLSNGRQVALAAKLFAEDRDGRFPVHLFELIPDYLTAEDLSKLRFAPPLPNGEAGEPEYDWLYFGAFQTTDDPLRILMASPTATVRKDGGAKRVVIAGDLAGRIISEEDYQRELRLMISEFNERLKASPERGTNAD